jgi:cell division protease FtsH
MKDLFKNIAIIFIIFLVISAVFSSFGQSNTDSVVDLGLLAGQIREGKVSALTVTGDKVNVVLSDGSNEVLKKEAGAPLSQTLNNLGISEEELSTIKLEYKDESGWEYALDSILPFILPLILVGALFFFTMRGMSNMNSRAMSFGQSGAKEQAKTLKKRVTFKDVAGAKEAKEELKEVVDFLRFPKKFRDLGARIPKGVLLLGSPGTGKTLLARSVAGEANVPFFHMSGSEFVEMFVGVGASRVRSLFEKAKKAAPCIVFIDEIDAVGRRRGSGLGGSHDEREQTLNQILVEMDGFEPTDNVIVIAATNRPDVLDPALLRPGRFDRQVFIDRPDLKDRQEILAVHSISKPLAKDVDLKRVAERTSGFSGADLENLLNEAAILAARKSKKDISGEDIFEAIEKVMIGPARKSRVITEKEKRITAYHEAGHAIVAHFLPNIDPVQKISIISRGQAGGYTIKVPLEDRNMHSKTEFIEEIAVLLAGHVSEESVFGEVTTGATSDLRRATAIARSLVTDYGMSENLGARTFGEKEEMIFLGREIHEQRDYSDKVAEKIDEEIAAFMSKAERMAIDIVSVQRQYLDRVSEVLLEKETLEKEDFEAIVGKKPKLTI